MSAQTRYRFGFDIGGTFTDFVLCDTSSGALYTYKTLTTPDEPGRAVIEGWQALLAQVGAEGSQVELSIHGTTLITNALIERKGARTALVTTAGFADTLDTQREMRYDIYDLHSPPVTPLVPRSMRCEVEERMNAFGEVVTPLNEASLEALAAFIERTDPQAVAIGFLHAYRNGSHEQQVAAFLRERFPNLALALSFEVAPEIREYERLSTTVANAYVQPLAQRYVLALEQQLQRLGYPRDLYLMLSSGGITVAETAARFPIRLVESGPAAGALAAIFYGNLTGHPNLVSFDMGGTTAKLCVINQGQAQMTHTFEIARRHRFKRGSGLPVRIPAIELIEIGAGGGSIARLDDLGLLKVGPHSAGADPGPACYGRGGTQPTVTDANLLLGYLNPDYFLGGRLRLDRAAAEAAMTPLAAQLERSVAEAAYGIYRVVNESMIAATRVHVAERGVDPRMVRLMAFGGAGPAHADALARALKMQGYLIPTNAGVASALGFLTAPTAFDLARTVAGPVTAAGLADLDTVFAELEAEGRATLARAGVSEDAMHFGPSMDLRHVGQGHEVTVRLPAGRLADLGLEGVRTAFFAQYEAIYGYAHRHLGLEVMTLRLTASGGTPELRLEGVGMDATSAERAIKNRRPIFVGPWGRFADVPVYDRYQLRGGAVLTGPCLIEEPDSTAVIGPDVTVEVDAYLNLIATFVDQAKQD
ncbi:MAG: hydantoinase/oxoprolinase family protein [Oscillochloridaceae bacterium umkhey_bin13]